MLIKDLVQSISQNVTAALEEDIRTGDLTAQLIPESQAATASVISRQEAVMCGAQWFEACFTRLDPDCKVSWSVAEGKRIDPDEMICEVKGKARALLTAERSALNFLQTLSGTATLVRRYIDAVAGLDVQIMDTRKTLPGLRMAQKYAVGVGGGHNQRVGLYDGVLIKENHIIAAGSIRAVMEKALSVTPPDIAIQIEVETLQELSEALEAGAKLILLDNFSLDDMRTAVAQTDKRAELEASGNVNLDNVRSVAETGVDRISIGAITKNIEAVDLSMRIQIK